MSLFVSRPEDLNCCFWDMLLLLVWEPDFEFLWQTLSHQPDEAASSSGTSEGGPGAVAPPGGSREDEDLPQADEAAAETDEEEEEEKAMAGDQASGGFSPHPQEGWSLQALRQLERLGHPKIWKAYHGAVLFFISYRGSSGFPSVWPIPAEQFQGFLLSLDRNGVSAPKIFTYLSALSYLSWIFHGQDPLSDVCTSRMIMGMQWQREPPIPLNVEILESLMGALHAVCDSFYECLMFRALFLLSFHAALRPKEMVAETFLTSRPELLCVEDVNLEEDCVGVMLLAPEMEAGWITRWLDRSENPVLCPVLALQNYLAVRPRDEGPLFLYNSWRLLCKQRFLEVFHAALRRLNLPLQRFHLKSFWLGSLTNAIRCGFPESEVLYLARWPCRPLPGA